MKITFSKKAGLQMSINAIVVLVMAMVVLGLGLGFIRGMFNSAEDKFSGAIDNVELTNPPTAENPFTFEKGTITVKDRNSENFIYSIYNREGKTLNDVQLVSPPSCSAGLTATLTSVGATIPDGGYTTFMGSITADGTPQDMYVCTITATSTESANFVSTQLTIKIS